MFSFVQSSTSLVLALASTAAAPLVTRHFRCTAMVLLPATNLRILPASFRANARLHYHCWCGAQRASIRRWQRHDLCTVGSSPTEQPRYTTTMSTKPSTAGMGNSSDINSTSDDVEIAPPSSKCGAISKKKKMHASAFSRKKRENEWAKARKDAMFNEEGESREYQELLKKTKTRFASRVKYDGTRYRGFQLQNGLPTVQYELEKALSRRFQRHVRVVAAGRTDAGVHALGQTVHFDLTNPNENLSQLTYSMNRMLPSDIRVWNMSVAPPCTAWQAEKGFPWSSMLNAKGKVYSYRLFVGKIPSPLDRLYRAHANQAARATIENADLFYKVMPLFVGKHDFVGFSNEVDKITTSMRVEGVGEYNTFRTVYSAKVVDEGAGNFRLDFHLDGALYRMVRNIVGTMLAISAGRVGPEVVEEIFRTGAKDSNLISSAPAHGLTLETVYYDDFE